MGRYMLRRLLTALLTVALVTVLNFLLMRLAPGDPVQIIAGMNNPSAEQMAALTERYGLNVPRNRWSLRKCWRDGQVWK